MAVGATNTILQDRLVIDMSEKIAELEPNKSPLITLTKKMKKKRTVDRPEYDWMDRTQVTGGMRSIILPVT